ncbi:MAG: DMT family transporter [Dehalococcoidia bacterium]|nr:DMT family transporter [Dehalococcoidia bacterium]
METPLVRRWGLVPEAALALATAAWGSTFAVIQIGLEGYSPFAFVALRFGVAAAVLAVALAPSLRQATWADWRGATVVGAWLFAGYALQTTGLTMTTASNAAFITSLSVVIVPFVAWAWLGQRPTPWGMGGAVVATLGLALLTLDGSLVPELGDLLVLACALAFAVHIVALARHIEGNLAALLVGQLAVTALMALPFAVVVEGALLPPTPVGWAALLYTALIATVATFAVQTWAQRRVSAMRVALIFVLEPVFAAAFAAALIGELMSPRQLAGAAIVVLGTLLGLRRS